MPGDPRARSEDVGFQCLHRFLRQCAHPRHTAVLLREGSQKRSGTIVAGRLDQQAVLPNLLGSDVPVEDRQALKTTNRIRQPDLLFLAIGVSPQRLWLEAEYTAGPEHAADLAQRATQIGRLLQ